MASTADHATRRDALRAGLQAEGLNALLVTALTNVRYLTGFTGSAGQVLIGADPAADRFVTDDRYALQAAAQVPDLPSTITRTDDWLAEALAGMRQVGLEADHLPWARVHDLTDVLSEQDAADPPGLQPTRGLIARLRERKDDIEIARIARAADVAARALEALYGTVQPDWTERDAAVWLERTMVDLGAEAAAFPTIVAAGTHGAKPHHAPADTPLGSNQLITIDFGARVDGYHSDCTRVCSFGEPSRDERALFEVVYTAQQQGVAALADGIAGVDADAVCRAVIRDAGYGDYFRHGTGHGIGLEVHEGPSLSTRSRSTLTAAMVVTVEPGIYIPDLGGARVEDTVAIGSGQAQVLTATPTPLAVL